MIAIGAGPQSFHLRCLAIFASARCSVDASPQRPSHLLFQCCQAGSARRFSIVSGLAPLSDSAPRPKSRKDGLIPWSRLPRNWKAALASGSSWMARYSCLSHGRNLSGKGSSSSMGLRNGTLCVRRVTWSRLSNTTATSAQRTSESVTLLCHRTSPCI